jgi:hypothetical protein
VSSIRSVSVLGACSLYESTVDNIWNFLEIVLDSLALTLHGLEEGELEETEYAYSLRTFTALNFAGPTSLLALKEALGSIAFYWPLEY